MSRSVLVTGGNRGIGLAVARQLHARGDRVMVTYRDSPPPDDLRGVRCDVTDPAAVERAFKQVAADQGDVEVLVSNAGIIHDALLLRMADENVDRVLDTNLRAAIRLAKLAARGMLAGGWGRLVLISSSVAFTGSPGQVNYAAAKSGLLGVARSLAWELGTYGITVNLVAPGLIDTDMTRALPMFRREEYLSRTPLRRAGTSEEVAAAVSFLVSDAAGYITGAVLPVSGGLGMGF